MIASCFPHCDFFLRVVRNTHGKPGLKCPVCLKDHYNTTDMRSHVLVGHCRERDFVCDYCGTGFATHIKLERHNNQVSCE